MRSRMTSIQVLACCLSMVACQQSNRQRYNSAPAPPNTTYRTESVVLTTKDTSRTIRGAFVTPAFFKAVREHPLLGRHFVAEDHQSKDWLVVILSHELWQERFGSDPTQIGKSAVLNGRAYTIVGVMPKGFNTPAGAEVWLPEADVTR